MIGPTQIIQDDLIIFRSLISNLNNIDQVHFATWWACLKEPGIGVDAFGAIILPTNGKWLTNLPEVTQLSKWQSQDFNVALTPEARFARLSHCLKVNNR